MSVLAAAAAALAIALQIGECAAGKAEAGNNLVQVWVRSRENGELEYPRVVALSRNADRTFGISVNYDGSRPDLSTPMSITALAYMPLSERTRIRETIQWRRTGERWVAQEQFVFPFPLGTDGRAYTENVIAWGGDKPRAPELLASVPDAPSVHLRRITETGTVLKTGKVELATPEILLPLYEQAKAEAVAKLPECGRQVFIPSAILERSEPPPTP